MRPARRPPLLALAMVPIGTIGGHLAGYGVAGTAAGLNGGHSHLMPTAWIAVVAALAALGWVAGATGPRRRSVHLRGLAWAQAVVFVALEGAEHAVAGHGFGHLVAEPALRWGLAAQVVTAGALVLVARLARASGDRVRSLLSGRDGRPGAAPRTLPPVAVTAVVRCVLLASSARPRGPPRTLVSV